ncbi:MAG: hypothetical protein ACJ0KA_04575 [Verrucomicrobiales bacterium]
MSRLTSLSAGGLMEATTGSSDSIMGRARLTPVAFKKRRREEWSVCI